MFKLRSYSTEMLDESDIRPELLFQNLKELEFINQYLGGHSISLSGFKQIVTDHKKVYRVIDIGCGGGDSLKAIYKWTLQNKFQIQLTGIDLKQDCIDYAIKNCSSYPAVRFRCDDFRNVFTAGEQINIVHASLFCHHFTEQEIVSFIQLCSKHRAIFIINDLERNAIAHYAIKILTRLFSKSPLVKNDAPLSVLRGFKKREWKQIIEQAGIKKYSIRNKWAFRHLVIIYPNE